MLPHIYEQMWTWMDEFFSKFHGSGIKIDRVISIRVAKPLIFFNILYAVVRYDAKCCHHEQLFSFRWACIYFYLIYIHCERWLLVDSSLWIIVHKVYRLREVDASSTQKKRLLWCHVNEDSFLNACCLMRMMVWFGMKHVLAVFAESNHSFFFEKTKKCFYAFYIYWQYENIIIDSYLS